MEVARLDRRCLGQKIWCASRTSLGGIFDKQTRRKPLAVAADVVAGWKGGDTGGLAERKKWSKKESEEAKTLLAWIAHLMEGFSPQAFS